MVFLPQNLYRTYQTGMSLLEYLLALSILSMVLFFPQHLWQPLSKTLTYASYQNRLIQCIHYAQKVALMSQSPVVMHPIPLRQTTWTHTGLFMKHAAVPFFICHFPSDLKLHWWGHFQHQMAVVFLPSGNLDGQQGHFYLNDAVEKPFIIINISGQAHVQNSRTLR